MMPHTWASLPSCWARVCLKTGNGSVLRDCSLPGLVRKPSCSGGATLRGEGAGQGPVTRLSTISVTHHTYCKHHLKDVPQMATRLSLTIPEDVALMLKAHVSKRERSAFVTAAIREKLQELEPEASAGGTRGGLPCTA